MLVWIKIIDFQPPSKITDYKEVDWGRNPQEEKEGLRINLEGRKYQTIIER